MSTTEGSDLVGEEKIMCEVRDEWDRSINVCGMIDELMILLVYMVVSPLELELRKG